MEKRKIIGAILILSAVVILFISYGVNQSVMPYCRAPPVGAPLGVYACGEQGYIPWFAAIPIFLGMIISGYWLGWRTHGWLDIEDIGLPST